MPQGVGGLVYLSDENENVSRVSTAGRAYFSDSYERIKLHSAINIVSASGGTQLESCPVGKVILRSESGNSIMWWGGTGDDAPYSGHGFPLWGGETSPIIPVTNFSSISVVASVSGQILYPIGFLNGSDVSLANTSPELPDVIAPTVLSHSPLSGVSGVSRDAEIYAIFSEQINSASVTSGNFRLSPAHDVTVFRDTTDTSKVVLRPNINFSGSTRYMAELTTNLTDRVGNRLSGVFLWPFNTTAAPPPPDTTPPVISGITPASGATGTGATVTPVVTFSEAMLSGTINTSGIFLSTTSGGTGNVPITVTLDAGDRKTVTIDPVSNLANGQTYYVNILTSVQDLASNALAVARRNHRFETSYTYTEVYNVNSEAGSNNIGVGLDKGSGVKVKSSCALKDAVPKKIVMKLKRGSTLTTDNGAIRIRDASNNIVATFAFLDGNSLTTSYANYTFINLDNTTALATNYSLFLEYDGPGHIVTARTTSDSYTGAVHVELSSSGTQNERSSLDVSWQIYK